MALLFLKSIEESVPIFWPIGLEDKQSEWNIKISLAPVRLFLKVLVKPIWISTDDLQI